MFFFKFDNNLFYFRHYARLVFHSWSVFRKEINIVPAFFRVDAYRIVILPVIDVAIQTLSVAIFGDARAYHFIDRKGRLESIRYHAVKIKKNEKFFHRSSSHCDACDAAGGS